MPRCGLMVRMLDVQNENKVVKPLDCHLGCCYTCDCVDLLVCKAKVGIQEMNFCNSKPRSKFGIHLHIENNVMGIKQING